MQQVKYYVRAAFFLSVLGLVACGGGASDSTVSSSPSPSPTASPSPEVSAAPTVTPSPTPLPTVSPSPLEAPVLEAVGPQVFIAGENITPIQFSNSGDGNVTCSADSLPSGLVLAESVDASTCELTGRPTVEGESDHTITASNATGESSVAVNITVGTALPALADENDLRFVQGQLVTLILENTGGGALTSCSDNLPAGLSASVSENATTCIVSGEASAVVASADFEVTATNASGDATATISLEIEQASPFITTWRTDNGGISDDNSITILTNPSLTYDYSVDWGDGTVDENITGDASHTYDSPDVYTVSITGVFPHMRFEAEDEDFQSDALKLLSVEQWGNRPWLSMEAMFLDCDNLVINDLENPSMSRVTSVRQMFASAENFNSDITGWDVSNVEDMSEMLVDANEFNQNLGVWDVTSVTTMDDMLSFTNLSLANYDGILIGWAAQAVNENVSLGANLVEFTEDAQAARDTLTLTFGWIISDDGLTGLEVPNLEAASLTVYTNNITELTVPNAGGRPDTCSAESLPEGLDVEVSNNSETCAIVGVPTTPQASTASTITATNQRGAADALVSIEVIQETAFITRWKTDNEGASADNEITIKHAPGFTYDYRIDWGDGSVDENVSEEITHQYAVPGEYEVAITGTFPAMFFTRTTNVSQTDSLKLLAVEQWGDRPWLTMLQAFANCDNLVINDFKSPDLSLVSNMQAMFFSAGRFNSDIADWDVSNVTNMRDLFNGATSFNQDVGAWDVASVTNMQGMFGAAIVFNQDIGGWNVSKVRNMRGMFGSARAFNQDIGGWATGNVRDMLNMFNSASEFNQDIGGWDVSRAVDMSGMFRLAVNFNQDISDWDMQAVTTTSRMFREAHAFNQDLGTWTVSKVSNMAEMFFAARGFEGAGLGEWDVSNVTSMARMLPVQSVTTENYDAMLLGWSQLDGLQSDVTFSAGNTPFSEAAAAAKQSLEALGWIITDGGQLEAL